MSTKEEDLKHAVWTIRSIIADDAFAASHQSLGQYRTALLTGIAKVMGEILLGDPRRHPALQALQQERDELRADLETERVAFKTCAQERYSYHVELVKLRAQVEALNRLTEPAWDANKLAEIVLSDCGCSSNHTQLLERIASRIEAHVQNRITRWVALTRPAAPEIDYPELISACYRITKRPQGTPGCVHFKAGAEWFRSVMLAAAPQPEATIKESSRVAQTTEAAQPDLMSIINAQADEHAKRSPLDGSAQPTNPTAENWLRTKYGAYRGHPEWRALEVAFNAGMAAQKGGA